MATATLTPGDIAKIKGKHEFANGVVLRVSDLQEVGGKKHRCLLSDGSATIRGVLASQFADLVASGELSNGALIKINVYITNTVGSEDVLLATDLTVVAPGSDSQPINADTALTAHNATPEAAAKTGSSKTAGLAAGSKENATPMLSPPTEFKFNKTPGLGSLTPPPFPTGTPTQSMQSKPADTPSSTLAISDRKNHHKIAQLNPYESNWCIKAKLERMGQLRSMSIRGSDVKILSVELLDDTGPIQGTFWRAAAERYFQQLVEGKVYVFHRFKVKPADKKYSTFKADYQIDFTESTEVSEAADQDTSAMTAAVEIVPIEALPRRVGTRAAVDVVGIVLALGSLGTVKRKADNSELPRRDVTLGDISGKSVVLTLWGHNASAFAGQMEGQEGKVVLQVTQVRVTDFNGCSLSSLTKSAVTLNPEGPLTSQLLDWYSTAGMAPDRFTPVGQDLAGASRASTGGAGGVPSRERFLTLRDVGGVTPEALPDDKAVFMAVTACVAMVNSEQQMYYLANPENGRKVVDQGGGRWAEADGKVVERAEHRYVLSLRLADHTGEAMVQLFNKEAEAVMGMKADDLAALKDAGEEGFAAALRSAQWRPWSVVVMSKAREYNGEKRVRHTAHKVDAMDWVSEGQRLVTLISKYGN